MSESNNEKRFKAPMGPIHPMFKEPVNFTFYLEGEKIVEAIPRIGYVHRGVEKLAESRNYIQIAYLVERTCGICSGVHQFTYCNTVERLGDISISKRSDYIRALVLELERIHSHLLWLGIVGHEVGFETLFMYIWKDREDVMQLLEKLSGNRVNYGMSVIGGVKRDLTPELGKEIVNVMNHYEEVLQQYKQILLNDDSIIKRTKHVGYFPKNKALELGSVGPTARASGVDVDLRRDMPYSVYPELDFNVIVYEQGDALARVLVRFDETVESIKMVKQLIEQMPEGEIGRSKKRRFPEKWAYFRSEAPRGELFYAIKGNGKDKPDRLKIRTPTLANISSVAEMLRGYYIADIPVIVAGIDPCMSCMDRVAVINLDKSPQKPTFFTAKSLREYSIKWYKEHYNVEFPTELSFK